MKFIFFLFILVNISCKAYCQKDNPTLQSAANTDYLKKSKQQKTTAWILLGTGITMNIVGLSQLNFAGSSEPGGVNNTFGTVLFLTGVAADAVSIPFFSAAARNKRKAVHATVNFGLNNPQGMYASNGQRIQYKAGIKISF